MWLVILSRVHLESPDCCNCDLHKALPPCWEDTHTHMHIHSIAGTHWVMMGLSSPIKACSSRLGSRAQSVEMDSSQKVLGLCFLTSPWKCTAAAVLTVLRRSEWMFSFLNAIFVSFFSSQYHARDVSGWAHCIINPFFGHTVVSLMIIMCLSWKNKGIRWINYRFYNVTWFMGSAVINDHLIELEGNGYEINVYVVKENS